MAKREEKQDRGARNQSLFRDVNERIEQIADGDGQEGYDFLCECAKTDCTEVIYLTREEYEDARRVPTHFPVAPGHDDPEIERVVHANDRYAIVEKFGTGGVVAVERDPRRNARD